MKKIYKKLIFYGVPTITLLITMFVAISVTHGWYTYVEQKGEIDANTKNTGFKYKLDRTTQVKDEYSISNLAFFDIDSIYEGKYFKLMSYCLELEVENITEDILDYTVVFEADKYVGGNTNSYVACVMSTTRLEYKMQEEGKANTTYYEYDDITHKYKRNTDVISAGDDLSGLNLVAFDDDYMVPLIENTNDDIVKRNKTYYKTLDEEYVTRGNRIPLNESGNNDRYYEKTYLSGSNYNSYSAFTSASTETAKFYKLVESQSGNYYTLVEDDDEFSAIPSNYADYYVWGGAYNLSSDSLFQNETYYYLDDSSAYHALTTIKPGDTIPTTTVGGKTVKSYYEKGSKVKDLIYNTYETDDEGEDILTKPIIEYTPNYNSENSFMAKYHQGQLGINELNKTQVIYLYLIGVQEIDSATNPDFIENIHNFSITISATVDSSWDVENLTEDEGE